jgi:predicted cobalt transporter CbtA
MATTLLFTLVTSALGMAYIVYGKRQTKFVPLVAGIALCVYSYFVDGWLWLSIIGAVLLVLPFIVDF